MLAGHTFVSAIRRNRALFQAGDPLEAGNFVLLTAPLYIQGPTDPGLFVVLWSEPGTREGDYALAHAPAEAERRPSPLVRAPRWALRREHQHPLWRLVDRCCASDASRAPFDALKLRGVRQRVEEFFGLTAPCSLFADDQRHLP